MIIEIVNKIRIPLNIWAKATNTFKEVMGARGNQSINTPVGMAEAIRYFIEGKVVCDIGCHLGHFMEDMQRYAKKVIGTEIVESRYYACIDKGLEVYRLDALQDNFPDADVYFLCIDEYKKNIILEQLRKQGKKGMLIVRNDGSNWNMKFKIGTSEQYLRIENI